MKRYTDLEYLKLSKGQKFLYSLESFFMAIPGAIGRFFLGIGRFFKKLGLGIGREFADLVKTFKEGDWKTRGSYLVMGLGSIARGQVLRGLLFLLFEAVFIVYMCLPQGGVFWLSKLDNLGDQGVHKVTENVFGQTVERVVYGDNSFRILLYGVLTLFFIAAFIYTCAPTSSKTRSRRSTSAPGAISPPARTTCAALWTSSSTKRCSLCR